MGWANIPGWTDEHLFAEYTAAVDRAPLTKPSTFVEIGVAYGRSFVFMLERIAASGKPIALIGVDQWEEPWGEELEMELLVKKHGSFERAARHLIATNAPEGAIASLTGWLIRARSEQIAAKLDTLGAAGARIDFVFVDGAHDKASVLSDLRAWWPLIRSGGVIAGHDHIDAHPGVEQACREFFADIAGGYEVHGTCFFARRKP